jgi:hypothetical protein
MFKKILFIVAAWLTCATIQAAKTVNGVEISLLPTLPSNIITHGYYYCNFLVANQSKNEKKIELLLKSGSSGFENVILLEKIRKAFIMPPASSQKITLYWPHLDYVPQLMVKIDGKIFNDQDLGIAFGISNSTRYQGDYKIILTTKTVSGNKKDFPRAFKCKGIYYYYPTTNIPITQWPSNWLFFGGYAGIMLTNKEFVSMPESIRKALEQYVRLGGIMVIYAPKLKERFKKLSSGFGIKYYIKVKPEKLSYSEWAELLSELDNCSDILRMPVKTNTANSGFKVSKEVKVPLTQLMPLILVLVITIGLLNIYAFNRRKKSVWLRWLSPILAVVFLGLLSVYGFFSAGRYAQIKMKSLTFLNENSQIASSLGVVAYYCQVVPGNGLMFSPYTEVQPYFNYEIEHPTVTLDLTSGQNLRRGWLRPHIPGYFALRKGEPRQEKIQVVKRSKDGIEVLNGLGAPINSLIMIDFDGRKYLAKSIPTDRKVFIPAVKATAFTGNAILTSGKIDTTLRIIFVSNWLQTGQLLFKPDRLKNRGTYCATLKKSPFISSGMKSRLMDETCTVIGKMTVPKAISISNTSPAP